MLTCVKIQGLSREIRIIKQLLKQHEAQTSNKYVKARVKKTRCFFVKSV